MTAQKLRIGYRNVVVEHPNVEVSGAASGYPAVNATSWRYDERWRAPWTGNDLADLGLNWDVQTWTNGTSSAPDDWTLTGASATVARSSLHVFVDPYSALVTRVGTDCTFELDLDAYVASYRKQQVTFGLHVYSTSTNGRVYITDDTGTTTQAHGGAGEEFVQVTRTIDAGSTLRIGYEIHTTDHAVYIDGAAFSAGAAVTETPDAPIASSLEIHCNDYPVPNWLGSDWSAGVNASPDGWVQVNGSVFRSNTLAKVGRYSVGITRAGTDAYNRYRFSASQLAAAKGKSVGFGGHSWASVGNRATWALAIILRNGATEVVEYAGYHSGGSSWEWDATTSIIVPHDATAIELRRCVFNGDTTAYFDAPAVRIGGAVTETPHAQTVTVFALAGHNCGTVGAELTVQGSTDNFANTTELVAAFTPTDDKVLWKAISSGSYSSFRILVADATGQAEFGVPYLGPYIEMPEVLVGWSQRTRVVDADEPVNLGGVPMESEAKRRPVPRTITMEWVDESWTGSTLQDFLDHAGGAPLGEMRKRPFFVLPEGGEHPSDAFLMWLSNQTVEPVWSFGRRTEALSLSVLAVGE